MTVNLGECLVFFNHTCPQSESDHSWKSFFDPFWFLEPEFLALHDGSARRLETAQNIDSIRIAVTDTSRPPSTQLSQERRSGPLPALCLSLPGSSLGFSPASIDGSKNDGALTALEQTHWEHR